MLNNLTLRDQIKSLLISKPDLREDDLRIIANIWLRQLKSLGKQGVSAIDFLLMLSKGEFIHFENVRRERQKLQEHDPSLRGPNYEKRKSKSRKMHKALETYHNPQTTPRK